MSGLVIFSWVLVLLLTTLNIVVFVKLKQASLSMMKGIFPNIKNTSDLMAKLDQMSKALGISPQSMKSLPKNPQDQLKAAMDFLNASQKKK